MGHRAVGESTHKHTMHNMVFKNFTALFVAFFCVNHLDEDETFKFLKEEHEDGITIALMLTVVDMKNNQLCMIYCM